MGIVKLKASQDAQTIYAAAGTSIYRENEWRTLGHGVICQIAAGAHGRGENLSPRRAWLNGLHFGYFATEAVSQGEVGEQCR